MEFSENGHICHRDVLFCNFCCDFMLLFTFCKVHAWWDHLLVETCRVNVPLMQISHNLVFCSSWVKIKFIFFFTHKKDQNVLCSTHINGNKSNQRSLATPQSHKYRKLNALNFISCLKFISRNIDGKVLHGSSVQKKPVPLSLHLFLNRLWNISQKYTSDDYCFMITISFSWLKFQCWSLTWNCFSAHGPRTHSYCSVSMVVVYYSCKVVWSFPLL